MIKFVNAVCALFMFLALCAQASVPPKNDSLTYQAASPLKQDIYINVLSKGPKGCFQQARTVLKDFEFFRDGVKIEWPISIRSYDKKNIIEKDIANIEVNWDKILKAWKVSILIYDPFKDEKNNQFLKARSLTFTFPEPSTLLAYTASWRHPREARTWNEVLVGNRLFFESGEANKTGKN